MTAPVRCAGSPLISEGQSCRRAVRGARLPGSTGSPGRRRPKRATGLTSSSRPGPTVHAPGHRRRQQCRLEGHNAGWSPDDGSLVACARCRRAGVMAEGGSGRQRQVSPTSPRPAQQLLRHQFDPRAHPRPQHRRGRASRLPLATHCIGAPRRPGSRSRPAWTTRTPWPPAEAWPRPLPPWPRRGVARSRRLPVQSAASRLHHIRPGRPEPPTTRILRRARHVARSGLSRPPRRRRSGRTARSSAAQREAAGRPAAQGFASPRTFCSGRCCTRVVSPRSPIAGWRPAAGCRGQAGAGGRLRCAGPAAWSVRQAGGRPPLSASVAIGRRSHAAMAAVPRRVGGIGRVPWTNRTRPWLLDTSSAPQHGRAGRRR